MTHNNESDYCECDDCHEGRGIALKDDNDRRSRQIGAARYEAARAAVDMENDLHLRGLCRATCRYCVAIRQGDAALEMAIAALEEKRCTNQPA